MDEDDEHQVRAALAPLFDELFSSTLKHVVNALYKDRRVGEKDNPAISGGVIPVDFSCPCF